MILDTLQLDRYGRAEATTIEEELEDIKNKNIILEKEIIKLRSRQGKCEESKLATMCDDDILPDLCLLSERLGSVAGLIDERWKPWLQNEARINPKATMNYTSLNMLCLELERIQRLQQSQ